PLPQAASRISFFFQAEDGIRDFHVTGVQTCALPISLPRLLLLHLVLLFPVVAEINPELLTKQWSARWIHPPDADLRDYGVYHFQIGRASCRERGQIAVVAGRGEAQLDRERGSTHGGG